MMIIFVVFGNIISPETLDENHTSSSFFLQFSSSVFFCWLWKKFLMGLMPNVFIEVCC